MSCVIGFKYNDHFVIAGDSQSTSNVFKINNYNGISSKVIRVKDDENAVIALCGAARDMSLIQQTPGLFNSFNEDYPEFNKDYIRHVFIEKMHQQFLKFGYMTNKHKFGLTSPVLIARNDKCYFLSSDGCIARVVDWFANGSGAEAARGSLYGTQDDPNLLRRALKGMVAACKYDVYCSFPIILKSTKAHKDYVLSKQEVLDIIDGKKEIDL